PNETDVFVRLPLGSRKSKPLGVGLRSRQCSRDHGEVAEKSAQHERSDAQDQSAIDKVTALRSRPFCELSSEHIDTAKSLDRNFEGLFRAQSRTNGVFDVIAQMRLQFVEQFGGLDA